MDNTKVKLFCEYALDEHEDLACLRFFNEWVAKEMEDGIISRNRDIDAALEIPWYTWEHLLEENFS